LHINFIESLSRNYYVKPILKKILSNLKHSIHGVKMKSLLVSLLIAVSLVGFTSAQHKMAVGAGLIVSFPMGDFGDAANTGFGGTGAFEMSFMPQLIGVGNIGYITWGTDIENASFSAVPVTVGVKYYFVPNVPFYGLGQLGLTFLSFDYGIPEVVTPFGTFGGSSSSSSTEFTLVIGAGYEVPVSPTVSLDFTGGFNVVSDADHVTLRAGAKFAL
jgi:hypothetical protein